MEIIKKDSTISLWKFIAALMIMGHHGGAFWKDSNYPMHGGYIYVEFFFIVSGFFLMRFLENNNDLDSCLFYCKSKFKKIFPYTTLAFIIHYIIECIYNGTFYGSLKILWNLPFEITYLSNLHITNSRLGQLWYVASMLFVMPILSFIYCKNKEFYNKIFIWIVPILWYGYSFTKYNRLGNRGMFIDLVRASSNLLIGGQVYLLTYHYKLREKGVWERCFLTIIAWLGFLSTVYVSYKVWGREYDYLIVILFFISIFAILSNNTYQIRSKFLDYLNELSMAMYIGHITVRIFVSRFFNQGTMVEKYLLFYLGTIFYSLILLECTRIIKRYIFKGEKTSIGKLH